MTPENSSAPMSVTPRRRQVLKAAAWAVPAVTVATAAPAFATSPGSPTQLPSTGLETGWEATVTSSLGLNPYRAYLNRNRNAGVSYSVYDAAGDLVPDGSYFTTVTIPITWNFDQAVAPDIQMVGGQVWTVTGDTTPGTTGSFTLSAVVYNGEAHKISAPYVFFAPVGVTPTTGGFTAPTSGVGIGSVNGGGTID